jgi:hypothetical protein
LIFHHRIDGDVASHGIAADRINEVDSRYADRLLSRIFELSDQPVPVARPARTDQARRGVEPATPVPPRCSTGETAQLNSVPERPNAGGTRSLTAAPTQFVFASRPAVKQALLDRLTRAR